MYKYLAEQNEGEIIPRGLSALSILSKCLTLYCNIMSAAFDTDELALIVIRGEEDIISLFVTALTGLSLTHTFLTKSRSVIKPCGLPSASTTTNEVTPLFIHLLRRFLNRSHFFNGF